MSAGSWLVQCPSSSAWQSEGFVRLSGFEQYLTKERRKNTVKQTLSYAKRYYHILQTGDASELLTVSTKKRQHAMRALATLAKYWGIYNEWKEIKEKYGLKWTVDDSLQFFQSMTDGKHDYSKMLGWLKATTEGIPKPYANILLYCTLTGLRGEEACNSIELVQTDSNKYLNRQTMILEHYNYPTIFIRRTKKAYISIVNENILNIAKEAANCGYNALRLFLKHHNMEMNMKYCRKIHATYLRKNGIESELVDLLQGRLPKTVFARHYFRPDFDKERVRIDECLMHLHKEIAVT